MTMHTIGDVLKASEARSGRPSRAPKRPHISLEKKLAAALLTIVRPDENGVMRPVIGYEESKTLTAKQIIARFHLDHWPIRHADGGVSEPWNLCWRPVAEHEDKTRTIDVPEIAKGKRIRGETRNGPKRKISARVNPWPGGRKFQRRASA